MAAGGGVSREGSPGVPPHPASRVQTPGLSSYLASCPSAGTVERSTSRPSRARRRPPLRPGQGQPRVPGDQGAEQLGGGRLQRGRWRLSAASGPADRVVDLVVRHSRGSFRELAPSPTAAPCLRGANVHRRRCSLELNGDYAPWRQIPEPAAGDGVAVRDDLTASTSLCWGRSCAVDRAARLRKPPGTLHGRACWRCGDPAVDVDHVVPIADGSGDSLVNLRPACAQ